MQDDTAELAKKKKRKKKIWYESNLESIFTTNLTSLNVLYMTFRETLFLRSGVSNIFWFWGHIQPDETAKLPINNNYKYIRKNIHI